MPGGEVVEEPFLVASDVVLRGCACGLGGFWFGEDVLDLIFLQDRLHLRSPVGKIGVVVQSV